MKQRGSLLDGRVATTSRAVTEMGRAGVNRGLDILLSKGAQLLKEVIPRSVRDHVARAIAMKLADRLTRPRMLTAKTVAGLNWVTGNDPSPCRQRSTAACLSPRTTRRCQNYRTRQTRTRKGHLETSLRNRGGLAGRRRPHSGGSEGRR